MLGEKDAAFICFPDLGVQFHVTAVLNAVELPNRCRGPQRSAVNNFFIFDHCYAYLTAVKGSGLFALVTLRSGVKFWSIIKYMVTGALGEFPCAIHFLVKLFRMFRVTRSTAPLPGFPMIQLIQLITLQIEGQVIITETELPGQGERGRKGKRDRKTS